ncbi:Oligopeptide-binding protein AppA precursor [Pluralibacter gergoviae]|nr:Oligopeptide-binding protein AppA precursor [Pluralibacter gergoviae]
MRGNAAVRTDQLYDSLFTTSDDEPGSYYPLIAEGVRYASDFSWAEVTINPRARFHDGSPVTAEDVAWSFHKFMTEGVPQFRLIYKGTTMKAVAPLMVRIDLAKPGKEDMLSLFSLPVMPKKFWLHRRFDEPLSAPPLAGGPYKISAWRMGQYVVYSRVKDYWAANLPVNRGRWNFDTIRYDYYLDDNVAFEAFKAGAVDFRSETSTKKLGHPLPRAQLHQRLYREGRKRRTAQPRIPSGWPLISSARSLPIARCAKRSPSPSILSG